MLDFLKLYWRELASLIALVVSFILYIIRKPVSSSIEKDTLSSLFYLISSWIKEVECPGNGDYKKETVTNLALRYLKKRYGRTLSDDELSIWQPRISMIIELFLSTPQKKEVSYESKVKKS